MKISFITLGCKVNQYETQFLTQQFKNNGFEIIPPNQVADIYIINSCTVTANSDKKTRNIIHKLRSKNINSLIVLTGCFPQAFPEEAAKISGADIITGNKDKHKIFDLVLQKLSTPNINKPQILIKPLSKDEFFEKMSVSKYDCKTRAFIKIQDGCNRFCSYCIIPKARGPIRSKALKDIFLEASTLSSNGHKEIVLTGINLSSYGKDINLSLLDAVKTVSLIDDVKRVRLSSLEPDLLSFNDIKYLSTIEKFCPQFHLCLQSGCDETLSRMNRRYSTSQYLSITQTIKKYFNNPSITTDLMVGFPGESDLEFNKTIDFIKLINFSRIHPFKYSNRPGTKASFMPNQVLNNIKHQRIKKIIQIAYEMKINFCKSQIGLSDEVLFESSIGHNLYQGYSKNYTRVIAESNTNICGKIKKVNIINSKLDFCYGSII